MAPLLLAFSLLAAAPEAIVEDHVSKEEIFLEEMDEDILDSLEDEIVFEEMNFSLEDEEDLE